MMRERSTSLVGDILSNIMPFDTSDSKCDKAPIKPTCPSIKISCSRPIQISKPYKNSLFINRIFHVEFAKHFLRNLCNMNQNRSKRMFQS
jgi:hypothetical protein